MPFVATLVAAVLAPVWMAAAGPLGPYAVIDLGTLGGAESGANGVNLRGQVVGWAHDAEGHKQAFVWNKGRMDGLGFLLGGTQSVANAINDSGQITGYSYVSAANYHAFLHENGTMRDIAPTNGVGTSEGRAINASGAIVGSYKTQYTHNNGFCLRPDGLFIDIACSGSASGTHAADGCDGYGINDAGLVCGSTFHYEPNPRWWGYVWFDVNGDGLMDRALTEGHDELHLFGALAPYASNRDHSIAYDVNRHEQAVGVSRSCADVNCTPHAFLLCSSNGVWKDPLEGNLNPTNALMHDLGALDSFTNASSANAINDRSRVVGYSATASGTNHAVLWVDETLHDLNNLIPTDSGWILTNATAINEYDEIVGSGLHNGTNRAFFLQRKASFMTMAVSNRSVTLGWGGSANGATFVLETCTNLYPSNDWTVVEPTTTWPAATNEWVVPEGATDPMRFYRLQVVQPSED